MKTSILNTFKHRLLVTIFALLAAVGLQTAGAEQTNAQGQLSARDFKFVTDAVQGSTMEVTLGQLAAQKASDPAVRAFGQRMVQDHQKANQELMLLAAQKGVTVSATPNKKDEKVAAHLQTVSGLDFDKAYVKNMVSDHKKDVKEFQAEADKADDADLKNWTAKTLPILQEHLRLVESLETTMDAAKTQASIK